MQGYSEVVEKFPDLRPSITEKLLQTFPEIKSGKVYRGALWIVGEYTASTSGEGFHPSVSTFILCAILHIHAEIQVVFQELRKVLGEIPILASEQRLLNEVGGDEDEKDKEEKKDGETKAAASSKPRVLADGTYATETAYSSAASARLEAVKAAAKPPLRGAVTFL